MTPPRLSPPPLSSTAKARLGILSGATEDALFSKALRGSFIAHFLVVMATFVGSIVMPHKPKQYVPSVRVDLVGLPDIKKVDLSKTSPAEMEKLKQKLEEIDKAERAALKDRAKKAEQAKKETNMDPDAMSLKKKEKDDGKTRKKDMSDALRRMKALQAMEEEVAKTAVPAKGNILSKGSALSGEQNMDTDTYVDELVSRIREHWNLPLWLKNQRLVAKVMLFIDSRGGIARVVFTQRSGNDQFDGQVMKAIELSAPFPRPNAEIKSDGILLGFPL
jgi:outer membrane biosynthesis protein TonB